MFAEAGGLEGPGPETLVPTDERALQILRGFNMCAAPPPPPRANALAP